MQITASQIIALVRECSLAREAADLTGVVTAAVRRHLAADGATFVVRDGRSCYYADEDAIAPLWKGRRFPLETCIAGWVMLNARTATIEDVYADPRISAETYRPTFVKSLAMVPVRAPNPIGALGAYWAAHHMASGGEIETLQAIADLAAMSVQVRADGERERRVRLAVQAARLGIYDHDLQWGTFECDQRAREVWGFGPGAVVDEAAVIGRMLAEDRPRARAALDRAIDPRGSGEYAAEYRVIGATAGSERWVQATGRVSFQDGRAVRLVATTQDVTERKRAEERIRVLAAVVEESSDFIGVCTRDFRPMYLNESGRRMVGLDTIDEVQRTQVIDYFWPEDRPRIESEAVPALLRDGRWEGEVRFRHFKTGRPIHTLWNATAIRDESGTPFAWATISPNLDALKATESALREANRRKDEFLAMLGHELRNPLAAIASAVSILTRFGQPGDGAEPARAVIGRQVQHLSRLVDDLLDVSRVISGKIALMRAPMDLGGLVMEVTGAWRAAGRLDRHDVRVDASSAWVDADETRMEQVIANLLGNALKYTPHGGRVDVRVRVDRDDARLEVADTGQGLPAELIDRVFDVFVQGDRTLDRSQGGLGLGLSLVKALVEMHGGTVQAHSDGPGKGSVFTVRLPSTTARARAALSSPAPASGVRVLVVDDNDDVRDMLRMQLSLGGHEVHEAADGHAAVEIAERIGPDVALVDLGLPGLDGYEVARRIRASARGPSPLLVAITGYGRAEDRERALASGFDVHLTKPVPPEHVAEVVARSRRRAARP